MIAERGGSPAVRAMGLVGWSARSVFGWDPRLGCWWAQLWRDGSSSPEPDYWIVDAGSSATGLVRLVAEGTGVAVEEVDDALSRSLS
jgi:hypothetical protein